MNILVVKTSSLGDIIQSLSTLSLLKNFNSSISIDWIAEKPFCELLESHPLINKVIPIEIRKWKRLSFKSFFEIHRAIKSLKQKKYDVLFDLQGNIKSGLITLLARAKEKVGYSFSSSAEWPNIFFTTHRYKINSKISIQFQSLDIILQKQVRIQ